MRSNPISLSHGAQEKVTKQTKNKPVEYLEPWKLLDQSSRLQTVLEIHSENFFDCFCTDTIIVSDIALVSKVKFGKLCASKGLQAYIIKWRDLQDFLNSWGSTEVVAAVRSEPNEGLVE